MARESPSSNSLLSMFLVMLLIFQVSSMAISQNPAKELSQNASLSTDDDGQQMSDFSLEFGYDLAGKQLNIENIVNGMVRYETDLDIYHNEIIQSPSLGTPTVPDVVISEQQEINACWHNIEGTVNYYWADLTETFKHIQVDEVLGNGEGVNNFDCAIAVKENQRASILYTNGSDLKAGQIAYAGSMYSNGDVWHTRTILEDVGVSNVELAITPEHLEWGVFRDDNGALYRVNYTGAFWQTGLLESGPVGQDFELEITKSGDIYVMYTKENQAILMSITNGLTSYQVVSEGEHLHTDIGMTLDDSDLLKLFTSKLIENNTILSVERSLANQKNQISSVPDYMISSGDTASSGALFGDFNGDGLTDLVHSQAYSSTEAFSSNGRVSIYFGSTIGLNRVADYTWEGESDNQMMGMGLAVGDYNGDGFDDIAIGSPGANTNDGLVQFAFGSSSGLSETLLQVSGVSNPTATGDKYGYCLETVADLDSDNDDEILICSIDYQQGSDTGKIELFYGSDADDTWVKTGSPNQMLQGSNFGQSISADGDLNGDGFPDLVIGNTGDLFDSSGFSSVEVRYGSAMGFATNPDRSYQSISSGTLFGYRVEIINDMNKDGFDELLISEPYNTTTFNSGNLWVFYGNSSGVADQPSARIAGDANDLLGVNFASAGDTNDDGFNDLLITRKAGMQQSQVELILGSNEIIDGSSHFIASGSSDYASVIASQGDSNGDNLPEFVFPATIIDEAQTEHTILQLFSRKLFDVSEVTVTGESVDGKIQSSTSGVPRIILDTVNTSADSGKTQMISLQSDSQSDYWQIQTITAEASPFNGGSNFAITSSGSPYVFYINDGLNLRKYTGYTGIESSIATNSDVEFVSSIAGSNGDMFVAYYSPFSNQLFINVQTESGWSEQLVADSANISSPISLMVDALGSPFIIFRDDVTMELNIATKTAGWTVENLSTSGNLLAESFATAVTQDGQIHIAAILDDGNFNNLSVITVNEQSIDTSFVAIESDLSTKLALVADDNNGLVLSALTSAGSMMVYEKAIDSNNWNPILLPQPQNLSSSSHIDAVGGDIPLIVVNSQVNSVYARTQGNWEVIAENLGDSVDDFTIVKTNKHIIVIFRQANTGLISWHSMEFSEGLNTDEIWHSSPIDGLANQNGFSATYANDIIHLYIKEPSSNQITSVHLHKDSDNDHIFDEIDGLENIPNQWLDQDGDGYGDNKNAPLSDACPTQSGSSSLFNLGCFDADGDGYDDLIDDCNTGYGASWLGRIGCSDFDQDGWVDWNSQYPYGDIFSDNWKQVFDTDGDSYGDNHGPDCCDTWYDSNAPPGDAFPFDPKQYTDYDGDGYGDNSSDFIGGDACKFDYGTSYIDRLGCHDSDGDGASDPTNFWNESLGADIWPDDPTQWADSDGDGFGDNGTKNATNPDYFPNNIAATNDTDEDGYPDSFNEFYDGTNAQGLQIDGCPLVAGNSTNPFYGCVDSDGDNYRDIYTYDINPTTGLRENETGDAFPYDPNQWADTDGDGFGNFPGGELADVCPNAVGVVNGTLGIGCPLIDGNDEDGDFVINENDLCPDTQFGLVVDLSGCANNQLDDDNDGITNDADICPETVDVTTVDTTGCSLPQRQIDTDSDGIYDYLDLCKSTPLNEIPDFDGCSLSQKDSDGDGVTDDTDVCPETPENYPVLSDGCTDESAKEIDWDGDGYTLDDLYMFEPTQWADSDGDGYGDNPLGVDGDQCPEVSGTSTRDRLGCIDSDLDGYSNPTAEFPASPSGLADAFLDDITQWRDIDGDGYGDNSSGANPDLCPSTNPLYKTSVDLNGCAANERDTDNDGIVDSLDNCPSEARGIDGYNDGCPLEKQSDSSSSTMILGMSIITFISLVTGIVILLMVIIVILRNRGLYDEDWFEDDDDFDDEYQEDRLSFLDRERGKRRQQLIQRNNPPRNGPVGAPPLMASTMSASPQPTNKPVPKPPRFTSKNTQSRTPPVNKKVAKKVKKSSESEKKVKRAVVDIEEDIFENIPKSSIDDAIEEIGDVSARDERQLLMHLQERGWNAPQSRALINLAKTKSR